MRRVPFGRPSDYATHAPEVVDHLRHRGLIAYPTETVYGFGCTLDPAALERLAALKSRAGTKPFLLLVLDRSQAVGLDRTEDARRLAEAFWPGPLTLALRALRPFPARVTGVDGTVAVRATPHPGVRALLERLGGPITSTSVNLPGEPPATDVDQVLRVAAAVGAGDDLWILDGGPLPPSPPSTIVDCSITPPRILRHGAITLEELRRVVDGIHGG